MGISEGISCSMVLGIRKSPYLWKTMIKRLSILLWSFALRTVHQMCGMMWQFLNTSTNSLTFLSPKNAVYELSPWKWAGSFFCFNHWNTEEEKDVMSNPLKYKRLEQIWLNSMEKVARMTKQNTWPWYDLC